MCGNRANSHVIDLFIYSFGGKLLARETEEHRFLQALADITLQLGDMRQWKTRWNRFSRTGAAIPGLYLLEGSVQYVGSHRLAILILP